MFARPIEASSEAAQHDFRTSTEAVFTRPNPRLGLIVLVAALVLGSALLITGVMALARIGSIPAPPELLLSYLPGNPLPEGTACYVGSSEVIPRCSIHYLDHEIHFTMNPETHVIDTTIVPAREYTIGELIVSWGSPISISDTGYMVRVDWNAQSALLYTRSFQPDSRVEFITYDLEPKQASPWRGFGLRRK